MTDPVPSDRTVTLVDAVRALDDRKRDLPDTVEFDSAGASLMVFGFELDLLEMKGLAEGVGRYARGREEDVGCAAAQAWMDGVLSGLMLAELRR